MLPFRFDSEPSVFYSCHKKMASEDEMLSSSDAEVDSEAEDDDMEKEFGHWLQQLESVNKVRICTIKKICTCKCLVTL